MLIFSTGRVCGEHQPTGVVDRGYLTSTGGEGGLGLEPIPFECWHRSEKMVLVPSVLLGERGRLIFWQICVELKHSHFGCRRNLTTHIVKRQHCGPSAFVRHDFLFLKNPKTSNITGIWPWVVTIVLLLSYRWHADPCTATVCSAPEQLLWPPSWSTWGRRRSKHKVMNISNSIQNTHFAMQRKY